VAHPNPPWPRAVNTHPHMLAFIAYCLLFEIATLLSIPFLLTIDKSHKPLYSYSMILLAGKVIRGEAYGRNIGFPTANIDRRQYAREKHSVKFGVYAGYAILPSGKKYKAGIVIGPLDSKQLPKLEAHIINFKGILYDKKLTLILKTFLRPFKRFPSEMALKKQITKDVARIKKLTF